MTSMTETASEIDYVSIKSEYTLYSIWNDKIKQRTSHLPIDFYEQYMN
mgnify:CR=1 FL=1